MKDNGKLVVTIPILMMSDSRSLFFSDPIFFFLTLNKLNPLDSDNALGALQNKCDDLLQRSLQPFPRRFVNFLQIEKHIVSILSIYI